MLKICFIKLKETWQDDQYSDPPLGLLYVMGATKEFSKEHPLDITFLDMAHETEIPEADVYAMSTSTLGYPEAERIAREIKEKYNGHIIIGGPHFNVFHPFEWNNQLNELPFDTICVGEGEQNIINAIELLEDRINRNVKNVITQNSQLSNLDTLPFPAREFLDKSKYFKTGKVFGGETFNSTNSATMLTSRGCPYDCDFCASPKLWDRKVRYRSPENVKEELEILKEEYNVREIRFQDDCFSLKSKRFGKLVDILAQAGIKYRCSSRVDHINDEVLDMLWYSGCRELGFGIESAEDHVLKLLNKRATVEQNIEALKKAKERGFKVRAFMMTGCPGETKDSAKYTIDFLEKTQPDVITLTSFIPLPGCDIFNHPEKYGVTILTKDWSRYDIALKLEAGTPFVHTISTATLEEMERNREMLKGYIFTGGLSNVQKYNRPYKAKS